MGREYSRVWIYVPTKVKEDTTFPFEVGDPCFVKIAANRGDLSLRPMRAHARPLTPDLVSMKT